MLYINRLAPQPCGTPYTTPFTEFHGLTFRSGSRSFQFVSNDVLITAASLSATMRSVASPELDTTSYWPVLKRLNASSDVPKYFTVALQPVAASNGFTQLTFGSLEPFSA